MTGRFAGVLGPLAFATTIARGLLHGGSPGPTLFQAWLALIAFAGLGHVAGRLAGWFIDESLRTEVADRLAAAMAERNPPGGRATG